jgi:hypothetical protein
MPLGDDESKVKRWALFNTNSAVNFNRGVVTCSTKSNNDVSILGTREIRPMIYNTWIRLVKSHFICSLSARYCIR